MKNVLVKIRSLSDCYFEYFDNNKKLIIMKVVNVCYHHESQENVFLGKIFNTVKPFYTKPIDNLKLGIAFVSDLSDDLMICNINKINLKKYMALDLNDDINIKMVFPILHSKYYKFSRINCILYFSFYFEYCICLFLYLFIINEFNMICMN